MIPRFHVIGPGKQWISLRAISAGQAAIAAAEQVGLAGRYDVRHAGTHNRVGLFMVSWFAASEGEPAGWRAEAVPPDHGSTDQR